MSSLRINAILWLLLSGMILSPVVHANDGAWSPAPYNLGQGLGFPRQKLNVGGYMSLYYADPEKQAGKLSARNLSMFISKALSTRWELFTEIEIGDALEFSSDGLSRRNAEFDVERLYADYRASREINFRFGKFLTPVGRWNLIHADPLVWTPDRPLTTIAPFARHATGVMLYGDIAVGWNSLDYSLFADDSDLLDPAQKNELAFEEGDPALSPRNAFKQAVGGRVVYHFLGDTAQIGVSYVHMEMSGLEGNQDLLGADALWTVRRMEFSGEWVYRNSLDSAEGDEHGGFIQAVLPLPHQFYLIGRHEKYRAAFLETTATIDSLGITYRPHRAVSIKLERRDGEDNDALAPSGWLGSLAVLF